MCNEKSDAIMKKTFRQGDVQKFSGLWRYIHKSWTDWSISVSASNYESFKAAGPNSCKIIGEKSFESPNSAPAYDIE